MIAKTVGLIGALKGIFGFLGAHWVVGKVLRRHVPEVIVSGILICGLIISIMHMYGDYLPSKEATSRSHVETKIKAEIMKSYPSDTLPLLDKADDTIIESVAEHFIGPEDSKKETNYIRELVSVSEDNHVWRILSIHDNIFILEDESSGRRMRVYAYKDKYADRIPQVYNVLMAGDRVKFIVARGERITIKGFYNEGWSYGEGWNENIYLVPVLVRQ